MGGAGEFGLGERFEGLLGQPQVFARGDLEVDRRAKHDHDRVTGLLHQRSLVGERAAGGRREGPLEQGAGKDLRCLRLPKPGPVDGLGDQVVGANPHECGHDRSREDRGPGSRTGGKDPIDPFRCQAGPGCVVDRYQIDGGVEFLQTVSH